MDQRYPVGARVSAVSSWQPKRIPPMAATLGPLRARRRRIEPRKGTVDLIDAHHLLRQRLPAVNWSSVV